jgi:hypothetical protein
MVYLFFSVPTIVLGFAAAHLGLYVAVCTFAGIIAILTMAEMAWLAIRHRTGAF